VLVDDAVVREATPPAAAFAYTAAMAAADGAAGAFTVAVSEIGPDYGPGPEARIDLHG
jgi:hypothetical protein